MYVSKSPYAKDSIDVLIVIFFLICICRLKTSKITIMIMIKKIFNYQLRNMS